MSEKFVGLFNRWQVRLQGYGYTNFSQLMNAKDYGVPQNRMRVFMVSVLDCKTAYYFPKPFKLEKRLRDVLEQEVDERYYLSDAAVERLVRNWGGVIDTVENKETARTICAVQTKITTFDNYIDTRELDKNDGISRYMNYER